MHEDAGRGVRRKKDSTLVRAAEAVRDGTGQSAMISAGNTGATMASALLRMGRIKGVKPPGDRHDHPRARLDARPSCSTPAPTPRCSPTGSCSSPRWARSYARHRFGIAAPRVGLLSIGEEPGKGDTLRKEAFELLTAAAADIAELDFIGNVEGRDVMSDTADVIVTDGFTGNVVLKTLEGGLRALVNALLARIRLDAGSTSSTPTP